MPFRIEVRPITWAGAWQAVVVSVTLVGVGGALMAASHSYTLQILGYCFLLAGLVVFLGSMLLLRRREKLESPILPRGKGGYQDWQIEGPAALRDVTAALAGITDDFSRFTPRIEYHVKRELEAAATGNPFRVRRATTRAARDITKFAKTIRRRAGRLRADAAVIEESYVGIAEWAELRTPGEIEAAREFVDQMSGMLAGVNAGVSSVESYRATALSRRGITRAFNEAIEHIGLAMEECASALQVIGSALERVISILRRKLDDAS